VAERLLGCKSDAASEEDVGADGCVVIVTLGGVVLGGGVMVVTAGIALFTSLEKALSLFEVSRAVTEK
jgi:hypothetical protein